MNEKRVMHFRLSGIIFPQYNLEVFAGCLEHVYIFLSEIIPVVPETDNSGEGTKSFNWSSGHTGTLFKLNRLK